MHPLCSLAMAQPSAANSRCLSFSVIPLCLCASVVSVFPCSWSECFAGGAASQRLLGGPDLGKHPLLVAHACRLRLVDADDGHMVGAGEAQHGRGDWGDRLLVI